MKKTPMLLLLSLLVAALTGCHTAGGLTRGPAPAWQFADLDGRTVKSSDYTGKVVLLNFWATWCLPCRMEIPTLNELHRQFAGADVAVIGVSIDEGGVEVVKRFVEASKLSYPVLMGDAKMYAAFGGIAEVPTTFLIDAKGNIAARYVGLEDKAVFEKRIQELLAARAK